MNRLRQSIFQLLQASALMAAIGLVSNSWAQGQEAAIRKNLSERIPQMPRIEEITRSPMAGCTKFG